MEPIWNDNQDDHRLDDDDEVTDFDQRRIIAFMQSCGACRGDAERTAQQEQDKLEQSLQILAAHPFNTAIDGGPSAVAGRYHFGLRKTIVTIVKISASLLSAGVGLVGFPPVGVIGAAAAVVISFDLLKDLLTKLSDDELDVYRAILEITKQEKSSDGLTASTLEQWFTRHYEAPPENLDQILKELKDKRALRTIGLGLDRKYSIVE